jgi:CRISPR system Cascade subunit CasE
LCKEEDLKNWIIRKGVQHGFKVLSLGFQEKANYRSFKGKGGVMITHRGQDYSGILEIESLEKFKNSLKNGIGSAKAFGFGLLSVMPYEKD